MSRQRRFHIEITQEIINSAVVRDSSHCVIADAVRASIPNAKRVSVDLQTIRWTNPETKKRYIALTPATAQAVLVNFDQGIKPEPFGMRVEPFQIVDARSYGTRGDRARTVTEGTVHPNETAGQTDIKRPLVEGGRVPPSAALSNQVGRRRTFGLRLLQR